MRQAEVVKLYNAHKGRVRVRRGSTERHKIEKSFGGGWSVLLLL